MANPPVVDGENFEFFVWATLDSVTQRLGLGLRKTRLNFFKNTVFNFFGSQNGAKQRLMPR